TVKDHPTELAIATKTNRLSELPGHLDIIPAAIVKSDNIFGALRSRLGTGIHARLFDESWRRRDFLPQNVYASTVLTLATSLFLAFVARGASAAFGLRSISVWGFMVISILGGVLGSIVVGTATVLISVASHSR